MNNCCGNCAYHSSANLDGDWVCENPESENNGVWTDYEDSCVDFEER